ncbi:MAG TPA: OsmC family peroxiredoxin [Anaerolineales bacterium]|nr:OsmC family peroxiredoxin [Anaerolineales bacterium]
MKYIFYQFHKEADVAIRNASAVWNGTLKEGDGTMRLGSGAFEGAFTFASRFEEGEGTNPEELVGAAQAGCFSMYLAAVLTDAGFPPKQIRTSAKVHLEEGPRINLIELDTEAEVPNIDEQTFRQKVDISKKNCPISLALSGPELQVNARLVK